MLTLLCHFMTYFICCQGRTYFVFTQVLFYMSMHTFLWEVNIKNSSLYNWKLGDEVLDLMQQKHIESNLKRLK